MQTTHRRTALAGTALATMALTLSGLGVAAQEEATPGVPAAPTGYAELDRALAGEFDGENVSIQVQWNSAELDNFEAAVANFEAATGIGIDIESIGRNHEVLLRTRVLGGDPPDLAQIAQPSAVRQYATDGHLVDMSEWLGTERFNEDFAAVLDLAMVDGGLYGVPYKVDVKSTVYYPKQAFEAAGYEVPTTWDELIALADQIVADGNGSPFCISMEHGAVTGWVGTDWVEDIMLRTASPEDYQAWIAGELPFSSEQVKRAFDLAGQIFFTEGYAYGGPTYINSTWVGQTQDPMFEETPQCWMHKQALWYGPGFWPDVRANEGNADYVTPNTLGEVIDVFYFPPIDEEFGSPALGSGDVFMAFDDSDATRAVAQFLATPEGAQAWIEQGIVSANANTPAEWYEGNFAPETASEILANATSFGFDASDLMPTPVGSGSFWTGLVDWVAAGGANTDDVLAAIDASWPAE
jgi:alpha-glucoside transport system substrate-binding protein